MSNNTNRVIIGQPVVLEPHEALRLRRSIDAMHELYYGDNPQGIAESDRMAVDVALYPDKILVERGYPHDPDELISTPEHP